MTEVRLYASHPDYKRFAFMQHLLVMATNPQMWFDIEVDVPEPERLATVELIKEDIERAMNGYQFLDADMAEIVNKLEEEMNA